MKKAKKIVAVALAATSMSLAFAGCGGSAESSKAEIHLYALVVKML